MTFKLDYFPPSATGEIPITYHFNRSWEVQCSHPGAATKLLGANHLQSGTTLKDYSGNGKEFFGNALAPIVSMFDLINTHPSNELWRIIAHESTERMKSLSIEKSGAMHICQASSEKAEGSISTILTGSTTPFRWQSEHASLST
jgi:hypothetical protein